LGQVLETLFQRFVQRHEFSVAPEIADLPTIPLRELLPYISAGYTGDPANIENYFKEIGVGEEMKRVIGDHTLCDLRGLSLELRLAVTLLPSFLNNCQYVIAPLSSANRVAPQAFSLLHKAFRGRRILLFGYLEDRFPVSGIDCIAEVTDGKVTALGSREWYQKNRGTSRNVGREAPLVDGDEDEEE
jgi:hypothetical protein